MSAIAADFDNIVVSRVLTMFAAIIRILTFRTSAGIITAFIIFRHEFKPPYAKNLLQLKVI
jgi:hypothetical protein